MFLTSVSVSLCVSLCILRFFRFLCGPCLSKESMRLARSRTSCFHLRFINFFPILVIFLLLFSLSCLFRFFFSFFSSSSSFFFSSHPAFSLSFLFVFYYSICTSSSLSYRELDSSVGIATGYGLDRGIVG
jgi:hypothetical protein